jgi:hypothetical protein
MGAWLWGWLVWLSTLEGVGSIASYPARGLLWLSGRRRGAVKGRGIEFFATRPDLVAARGSLAQRFKGASTAYGIWVIGQKFIHEDEDLHTLKKLLLPDPNDESLKYHSKVSGHDETVALIAGITKRAIEKGIKVKWYDHFIFNSLLLVDPDKPEGYAHIETVLPFSKVNQRPSVTIYKKQFPQAVAEIQRIFNEMWDAAHEPTLT